MADLLKIVLYTPSIHTGGGTERVMVNLSNELIKRGYKVTILSQKIGKINFYQIHSSILIKQMFCDRLNDQFGNSIFFKAIKKLIWGFIMQIELYRNIEKDSLAIISFSNSIIIQCFKTSFRDKLIAFEHWPYWKVEKNIKLKNIINKIYPKLKCVVVLTIHDKKIYDSLGCNVIIIPNAYTNFPEIPSDLINKNVLSIGHFNDQKRRDLLIKAWKIVNDKNPEWSLIIVGEGNLLLESIEQIKILNLQDSINIIHPTIDINQYYLKSSIFVLSSEYEALPMVLIEAKTFGLPCVSFDIETGPKEIINDTIDGFIVPFSDINKLAEKICELIKDNKLRFQYGKAARQDVISKYDPNIIYEKWFILLNKLKLEN